MTTLTPDDILRAFERGEIDGAAFDPLDVDTGQAIQRQVMETLVGRGETIAGYKVGLTSGAARDAFGAGVRPIGFILQSRWFSSGATLRRSEPNRPGLENEVAFRIAAIPEETKISPDRARQCVDGAAPAFEINEDRVRGRGSAGLRVAENLSQWGLVTGEFLPVDRVGDDLVVTADRDGEVIERVSTAGHIDDHFASLATLIEYTRSTDLPLDPGMVVITGSFTRFALTQAGSYRGDFGPLGEVRLAVE